MTPQEMIVACKTQIALGGENACVTFSMRGKWGSRNYRKIAGVKGEIICENDDDTLLVAFPAKQLMDAIIYEFTAGDILYWDDYGKTWLAYDRKPQTEEGTKNNGTD